MQKRSSKKRKDFNELAADIVDQATDEEPEEEEAEEPEPELTDNGKNAAAVALGRLGGKKGGKARAAKMTAAERKAAAKKAAEARWAKTKRANGES